MKQEKTKIGMISLGCPKNLVDTEVMLGLLSKDQYEITNDQDNADVMIVNTCAFIEDSKKESVDTILEVAELKKTGKLKKLVVTGCLAQRYKAKLERELPEVDHFVGTGEFQNITEFVRETPNNTMELPVARSKVAKPLYVYDELTPRISTLPKHTSYVKIAEGCSRTCSFCIIPRLRGDSRSRAIDSIVAEVKNLVKSGTKEVNLIAQDLTAYGLDREDGATLEKLLREMVKVEGIEWIRLMYNYPMYFTDSLIELIRDSKVICNYVDMPLQHIDSELLLSMDRKTDENEVRTLVKKLRQMIPGITLRTSLIVGFPCETQEQFEKLKDFVREMEFDRLGVFTYSQEEGTKAAMMPNQISDKVKKQRQEEIMLMQQEISNRRNAQAVGKTMRVMIDFPTKEKNMFVARSEGQAMEIDGNVFVTCENLTPGSFVDVKINKSLEYDLFATA
ncbi:MAG: 30S ribosomal protein S12 methylthiotransferase RimO [Proteobacteria bacterium]|nr:30S ribosomal protein S12 methylthiotransferase RimO [Pseudomonadota bacterium]